MHLKISSAQMAAFFIQGEVGLDKLDEKQWD